MSYHFETVQKTGDNIYFPLEISRVYVDPRNIVASRPDNFERYVFLTSFNESFESNWSNPPGAFGQLNPSYKYSQTNRKIQMSFKLPARNVLDSKSNLDFCSKMAKLVYGNYSVQVEDINQGNLVLLPQLAIDSTQQTTLGSVRYNFEGALFNIKVNFGNLIQNEFAFFTNFSFTPNFDAGVFEYNKAKVDGINKGVGEYQDEKAAQGYSSELLPDAHVYHNNEGVVYPKEIEVSISFTVLHDYPLGFGGPRRTGEPIKWAQNENKDWPHGTPESYPKLEYMSPDPSPALLTPQQTPSSPAPTPTTSTTTSPHHRYTTVSGSTVNYIIDSGGNIVIVD